MADTVKFTEAQENAIKAKKSTLLVAAGAGSGKTSVLTERIIQKICGGDDYDDYDITDFLVVTFTRASAADLKNKISKAINARLSEDINNVHLKRQQILLSRASISTIHSFCLDLIRANFEKLGLPAKFRMADVNEMSVIKRALLDDLLDKYYNSSSDIYIKDTSEIEVKNEDLFSYRDFISAVENFLGSRDDENIYNVIFKIYDKIISQTEPFKLFDIQIEIMDEINTFDELTGLNGLNGGFFSTKFGRVIKDSIGGKISECLRELEKMIAQIRISADLTKKYGASLSNSFNFFDKINVLLNPDDSVVASASLSFDSFGIFGTYDDIYYLCENYENIKVGSNKIKDDYDIELKEYTDKKNAVIRKTIADIKKVFTHDFADIKRFSGMYKKSLTVLRDIIRRFDETLKAEKMRRKSFEFSDLERFAYQLLVEKIGENGEIFVTDLAKRVKENYKEIYIDEYQDTNKLQDIIFKSISTEQSGSINGNRFMVGDIKQSIYAFRGAKSDIFANYSKLFNEYDKNTHDDKDKKSEFIPQKIYLRKNFRSSYNIISFINYIFGNLFSENLGGIEYTGGEVLESGRVFEDEETDQSRVDVTFAIVEKSRIENDDENNNGEIIETGEFENNENIANSENESEPNEAKYDDYLTQILSTEAEYVALTIKKLLTHGKLKDGENILPRHITVLMRNYTKSDLYVDALRRYGIACYTDKSKGFLNSAEIMLVVSLLRTIDNPMRDIDLAAVLKSPVFMFSMDDLIYIKRFNQNNNKSNLNNLSNPNNEKLYDGYIDPLFRYVRLYAEYDKGVPELKHKCADFLSKLNLWRAKSRILPVDKFIWYLYRQTDIMAKISLETFAAERKANLMLMYEYARKFESTTFKGLYEFLNYLNDVQMGKDDLERAKVISENSDVVKIMSVHKSKGLEFPVCIVANMGGLFNRNDYQDNPVISDEGIFFDLKYKDEIGTEKPPFKKLVAEKIKRETLSEEARILYVALTRAIEKLIVVGNADNITNFLEKNTVSQSGSNYLYGSEHEYEDSFSRRSLLAGADSALKWLTPILLNSNGTNKTNVNFDIDLVSPAKLNKMISEQKSEDLLLNDIESGDAGLSESDLIAIDEYGRKLKSMYDYNYKRIALSKVPLKLSVSGLKPGAPDANNTDDESSFDFPQVIREPEMANLPRFLEDQAGKTDNTANIAALAGTAAHLFMQFADFDYAEIFGARNEAENLLSRGFLTNAQYSRIKFDSIDKFFESDLYEKIKSAGKIYRETPFHLRIPVADFADFAEIEINNENINTSDLTDLGGLTEFSDEFILIQGEIDLFFEDKDGKIYVVDFKTDYIRSDYENDDRGGQILTERHKRQLGYYRRAVQRILNKPVQNAYIYSFSMNKAVEVF